MNPDVLIAGAGPAGLCLSLALARSGLSVTVVERQSRASLADPAFDGREIALTHGSMRILRELGVWQRIPAGEASPLLRARVRDGDAEGFQVDAGAFGHGQLGALVPNCILRRAAWEAVGDSGKVTVLDGCSVEAVGSDAGTARVRLEDGRRLDAPLLVAADSRFSTVRRAMGIPAAMHDFGKTMLVGRFSHERPHHGVATEWFDHGQTRALLPLQENLVSVVLTVTGAEAARLAALPPDDYTREIEHRLEHRLGRMGAASSVHAYPLVASWAHRFTGTRFALVGDAAVGMHPVTAHGFNLGLASVERLSRSVAEAMAMRGDPADPAALARYQRRHRAGALPLFLGTGAVVGLYTDDRRPMRPVRRGVLRGVAALPPLRRMLAAGLIDEGPLDPGPVQRLRRGIGILRPRVRPISPGPPSRDPVPPGPAGQRRAAASLPPATAPR